MSTQSNNPQGMPSMSEIMELARLLRRNGDKVLSASSKLSLSTALLSDLNDAFALIVDETEDLECSFQVCNSSKIDIFRDLKFLHDFVQKTVGLKITQGQNDSRINIDITKFRHLRYLELQKVSVESVKGLQGVRGQLESIVCAGSRGVGSVGRLLAACGGDSGVGFAWGSLRHLALPYNALARLDKSLELAPWLQTLDLSHNLISSAAEVDCLPNLKNVNLGYNKLETVPAFNKAVFHTLQMLVLKNNYIDNLSGLQGLECLAELDLSFNCLTEHVVLWPLETMSALLWVSLEGNPLSYHPRHRQLSIKHLHPSLSDSKFVLDNLPLSKSEKQLVGENRTSAIRSTYIRSASRDDTASLTGSLTSDMSSSIDTSVFNELMTKSECSDIVESMDRSVSLSRSRKKRSVKEAVIAEDDHEKEQEEISSSVTSSSNLEMSMDHLETKKQIQALRQKFGKDKWLSSHAGTFVQDIMGLERTPGPVLASTPAIETPMNTPVNASLSPSPIHTGNSLNFSCNPELEFLVEQKLNAKDAEITDADDEMTEEEDGSAKDKDRQGDSSDALVSKILEVAPGYPDIIYDPEKEKGELYLVQKKSIGDQTEELFLIVTQDDIKECDSITRKVKSRWATNTVLSCVMGRGEQITVDIIFDTARRDRQNRSYIMELDDAKKLVSIVSETLNAQPITLKVFKCMKCSTHFSLDVDRPTTVTTVSTSSFKVPKCPTCESTLVIQTDELSTPDNDKYENIKEKERPDATKDLQDTPLDLDLQHSPSHSSIGGTESEAISLATSLVQSESRPQAQARCSATSLDESRESTPSASTVTKRYESDIEIISNPSQSSIEVLDENSKTNLTPSRKRSSEERRAAIAPSLLTIPDTTPVMTGLTESSSSGSLTDSICTTYENKTIKHLEANGKSISKTSINNETIETVVEEKELVSTPVANLTSMLGGLLQSMKIGTSRSSPPKSEDDSAFVGSGVQYSYTDFRSIDHRVKLHIILNVFEHEKEELVLLLRAEILSQGLALTFPGCLVLSTSKVYVLRITGPEGEDPQRWLQKESSWTMDRLRTFAPLPFKQGLLVELHQPGKVGEEPCNTTIMCILQDFQRTSNFLSYLTDLPLPGSCEVEFSVPQHSTSLIHSLLKSSKNYNDGDAVRLLSLFSSGTIKFEDHSIKLKIAGLVVTTSALVVMDDRMQWLIPGSGETPTMKTEQAMSNLIEVEHDGTSLTLSYLDEVAGAEETWILEYVSADAAKAVINSVQPPWEELFSVPLQVTTKTP